MTAEQQFFTRLVALAKVCGANLTDDIVELYDRGLRDLGYDHVVEAITQVFLNRRGNDRMPSIRDIRELIMPQVTPEQDAVEAAGRIAEAIAKIGKTQPTVAREFIGELGWKVVEREGGWYKLCADVMADEIPTLKAQWRELAKAITARAKAGKLDTPPGLPESHPGSKKVIDITQRIGRELAAGKDD